MDAGAKVNQKLYDDPQDLSYWKTDPEGRIVINYALKVDVDKILKGGNVKLDGNPEGFLQGIKIGN